MSNTDSFVDEVTDEVRRDRLFAAFRKYGWIGVLLVVVIVGGAAYNEWQKSTAVARAEAFGDAAMAALQKPAAERSAALTALPGDKDQRAIQDLLLAANTEADKAGSLAALDRLAADKAAPQVYRDLAVLRRVALAGVDQGGAAVTQVLTMVVVLTSTPRARPTLAHSSASASPTERWGISRVRPSPVAAVRRCRELMDLLSLSSYLQSGSPV